jgi:hypothetical protein
MYRACPFLKNASGVEEVNLEPLRDFPFDVPNAFTILSTMNELTKAVVVFALAWTGLSLFRKAISKIEDEDLARSGAGESDFERSHENRS